MDQRTVILLITSAKIFLIETECSYGKSIERKPDYDHSLFSHVTAFSRRGGFCN